MITGYRPQMKNSRASTHVFKHNDKWYKLSLRIDEPIQILLKKTGKAGSQDIPLRDEY